MRGKIVALREEVCENSSLNCICEMKKKADMQILKFNYLVKKGIKPKYAAILSIEV